MKLKKNTMNKILTSPSSFGKISSEPFDILNKNEYTIINNPYGRKLTEEEVIDLAYDCVGIVAGVEPLTKKVMDALPKLKCISRVGIGMDSVDLDYAIKRGVKVVNTPDGPTRAVAEMTVALTFSLLRKIPQADANIKNGIWKKETGNFLYGKTIGVIGLGRIGKMVSEMFSNFGNKVIGYDINIDSLWAENNKITIQKNLNKLIQSSDILTLHVPPNKDNSYVIGKDELNLIKETAFLINASRGGVIDEVFLFELLSKNKIRGAAIDVFSEEPYSGPLTSLKNVILTPHLGSYAAEGKLKMEIDAVNNLLNNL